MAIVTSTRNATAQHAAALKQRKHRRRTGLHLAEGPHAVDAALAAGRVERLLVAPQWRERYDDAGVEIVEVTDHVLEAVADAVTPQGVIAVVVSTTASLAAALVHGGAVVLDRVADPGNVGTVVRTADAFGTNCVVTTTGCADVFSPKVVRATAGALYRVDVVAGADVGGIIDAAEAARRVTVGLASHGESEIDELQSLDGPVVFVGSESHGIAAEMLERLDMRVRIRMSQHAESLNAAVAAGIALHEMWRGPHAGG